MTLEWDANDERYYHHGVDRGVLYIRAPGVGINDFIEEPLSESAPTVAAFPWNGITGMDESGNGDSAIYYIDGKVFLADVDPTDFKGRLTAYGWPKKFGECLGMPEVAPGLVVDNQKPKQFDFSYRTLVGNGLGNDRFGYQIHLVYQAMASISGRNRKTVNNGPNPLEYAFDLVCTPVALPGYRPSAHYVIDTRYLPESALETIEEILYGTSTTRARMPRPQELYDLLSFGSAITFVSWTHPELGLVWTATGSSTNVIQTTPDTFEIRNVNGSWIDEDAGYYELQDTP